MNGREAETNKSKLWFRTVKVSCSKGNRVLKYNHTNYASENSVRNKG